MENKRVNFEWNGYAPNDILYTFLSLTTKSYPMGTESMLLEFIDCDLSVDEYGNYYKIIGESDTMFTSHLDTSVLRQFNINPIFYEKHGEEYIKSDGTTNLGADNKAGVTIMLHMIHHNIPGLYYFFMGEEQGGIGSHNVKLNFHTIDHVQNINKCISFDRRSYNSVIVSQNGVKCCSTDFAKSLCAEFKENGMDMYLDPTGIFTDSANFIGIIKECTNISVGYFNEHKINEFQNITFLEKLAGVCLNINWENLEIKK